MPFRNTLTALYYGIIKVGFLGDLDSDKVADKKAFFETMSVSPTLLLTIYI
jgi:hypothetical protein